jgi:hypothetical protein
MTKRYLPPVDDYEAPAYPLARREAAPLAASASPFLDAAKRTAGTGAGLAVLGIFAVGVGVLAYRGAKAALSEWWADWKAQRAARAEAKRNARAGRGIRVTEKAAALGAPAAKAADASDLEGAAEVIPIARGPKRKRRRAA